ncbi:CYTH domain-containing protein [Bacillus alkalicellulosilyticus]|uniref:CYTH domain-containing protein n=1 Tax=Alkalihalobacterium alkalicellulosilyticum TaxID=1912214 RepID=UPI000997C0F1|nr:CYTH domain-containing protein [Bacillus alkalicellulosilyticus]
MAKEIEIEAKNIVTSDEFYRVVSAFQIKDEAFAVQTNHYFDTADFKLKEKKAAMRIREKADQLTLTIKQPHTIGKLETHQSLVVDDMNHMVKTGVPPKGEIAEQLQHLDVEGPFSLIGSLTTARAELNYKNGILVFDKSTYLGIEDFELEYEGETEELVQSNFLALLQEFNIPVRKTANKIARFFEAKQRMTN